MIQNAGKISAIVVDDRPDFLQGIKFFLEEKLGITVIGEVFSGLELVNHELLYLADIILIDYRMPGMDGINTARWVNYLYPSKKLIALTMYQDEVCLNDLISAGFSGYVYKPDIVSKLESVIKKVLIDKLEFTRDLKIEKEDTENQRE